MSDMHPSDPWQPPDPWQQIPNPPWAGTGAPVPTGEPLRSVTGLGTALLALLICDAAISVFDLLDTGLGVNLVRGIRAGNFTVSDSSLATLTTLESILNVVLVLTYLATAVVWIVWQFRAAKNVEAWGVEARHTPGWVIAGWLIPFVNLVIPARSMQDVLRGSRSDPSLSRVASERPAELLVGWWWFAFLGANIPRQIEGNLFQNIQDPHDYYMWALANAAYVLVIIAAAVLAFFLVRQVRDLQELGLERSRQAWRAG